MDTNTRVDHSRSTHLNDKSTKRDLLRLIKSENGQGMVEYGLIIGLVVIAIIFTLSVLGINLKDVLYKDIQDGIDQAANAG